MKLKEDLIQKYFYKSEIKHYIKRFNTLQSFLQSYLKKSASIFKIRSLEACLFMIGVKYHSCQILHFFSLAKFFGLIKTMITNEKFYY